MKTIFVSQARHERLAAKVSRLNSQVNDLRRQVLALLVFHEKDGEKMNEIFVQNAEDEASPRDYKIPLPE